MAGIPIRAGTWRPVDPTCRICPIHPCGRFVDCITLPYRTLFWFGSDLTQYVEIQWEFCQEGALPLGFPCPFVSRRFDLHEIWPEIGEIQFAQRPVTRPYPTSRLPGTGGICGDPEVWRRGYQGTIPPNYPLNVYGESLCCGGPMGAAQLGALGYIPPTPDLRASGGIRLGGHAIESILYNDRAIGGLAIGGSATPVIRVDDVALGGLRMGCQPIPVIHTDTAVGGLTMGCQPVPIIHDDTAVGGLTMGCQPVPVVHTDTAVGGLTMGGAMGVTQSFTGAPPARGGAGIGGYAVESFAAADQALGGITAGTSSSDSYTPGGGGGFAYLQSNSGATTGSGFIASFSSPTTAGSLLVVCMGSDGTAFPATPAGWTLGENIGLFDGASLTAVYYQYTSASTSIVAFSGTGTQDFAWVAFEFSQPATVYGASFGANSIGNGFTALTGATASASPNELAVGALCVLPNNTLSGAWANGFSSVSMGTFSAGYLVLPSPAAATSSQAIVPGPNIYTGALQLFS